MKRRNRVFTYITNRDELLVFDHVNNPEAGTQIPGGTIELDEDPQLAATREATEETGIQTFSAVFLISKTTIDMRPHGKEEMLNCWFFHLETKENRGLRWKHAETSPSDGSINPIWFELYWVDIHKNVTLSGVDDQYLSTVRQRCNHA